MAHKIRVTKRDAVIERVDVEIEHIRTLFPRQRLRLVLSRERGENPILSVQKMLRLRRGYKPEFELYFRGKPREEEIKFIVTPPEKYKGFGYIILTREQALKLVEALKKVLASKDC